MIDRRIRAKEGINRRIALIWLVLSAILVLIGLPRLLVGQFPDPDDVLRLVQVRDLLGGQSWFDLHQYRINPPEGSVMHWSRLVDAPLALIIMALTPLIGAQAAELTALIAVPLLTLGVILLAIGRLTWRLFDARVAGFACMACGLLVPLVVQLQPMRIDHHGWQVAMVALALWAISWRSPLQGGAAAGIAMAWGASISVEMLPMTGAFGGILALRWMRDKKQKWWLVAYMQGLALSLAMLFLVTRGWTDLVQYCDAISTAHLGFFLITALGTGVIAALTIPRVAVAVLLALLGVGGLLFFAQASPVCMATPFAELDPLVRDFWYINVLEGRPFWEQDLLEALPSLLQLLVALTASIFLMLRSRDWLRDWWMEYALLLGSAILVSLLVWRSAAFAAVIGTIPLGWFATRLLTRLRDAEGIGRQLLVGGAMIMLLMPATPIILAKKLMPASTSERLTAASRATVALSQCDIRDSAALLNDLPAGTVFAPLDIGPTILLKSDHGVVATGHHRAQLAMRDVIAGFTASPDEARAILQMHQADYIAMCTDLTEAQMFASRAPNGLAAELIAGNTPDWAEPVSHDGPDVFRIWKVRK